MRVVSPCLLLVGSAVMVGRSGLAPAAEAPRPGWLVQREAAIRKFILERPERDRWKVLALLTSDDPADWQRANRGLRDFRPGHAPGFDFLDLVIALKRFPDRLEPPTKTRLVEMLGRDLADDGQWFGMVREVQPWMEPWGNKANYAAAAAILGGEVLGLADRVKRGREYLRRIILKANQTGDEGEFNSPPYNVVTLTALEAVAALADDVESRLLARWHRDRVLLPVVSRYHPASQQVAGPHSRHYCDVQVGAGCLISMLLDHKIVPEGVFWDAELDRFYHNGCYHPWQQDIWFLPWDIPEYLRHIASRKPLPAEVLSTVVDRGWTWTKDGRVVREFKGGPRDLCTYLTDLYALGTASGMFVYQPSGNHLLAHWPLADRIGRVGDKRLLWSRYTLDEQSPFADKPSMRRFGIFRAVQHRNKALVLYQPKDRGEPIVTPVLKMEVILTAFDRLPEIVLDGRRVEHLPVTAAKPLPVYLRDGGVFVGILPLEVTDLGREVALRIVRTDEQQLILSYYNFSVPEDRKRTFPLEELPRIRNGLALEIASWAEFPDFAAFQAHMARATVTDRLEGDVREVAFASAPDQLVIRYNPREEALLARQVNGQDVDYRGFRSPWAIQSDRGAAQLRGATLEWSPPVPVWLLVDPVEPTYSVWNLSDRPIRFDLKTPDGTVQCQNFEMGRLTLESRDLLYVTKEQLPNSRPSLRLSGAKKPMRLQPAPGVTPATGPEGRPWRR